MSRATARPRSPKRTTTCERRLGHGKGSDGQSSPTRPALEGGGEAGAQDEEGAQGLLEGWWRGGEGGGEGGGAQYRSLGAGDEGGTSSETALVPVGKSKEVTDIEKTVGDEAEAYAREARQSRQVVDALLLAALRQEDPRGASYGPQAAHPLHRQLPNVLLRAGSTTTSSGSRSSGRSGTRRRGRRSRTSGMRAVRASRIAEGGWAVVVLQDDLPEGSRQSFDEYGAKFVEKIRIARLRHDGMGVQSAPAYSLHHIARAHMKLSERLHVVATVPATMELYPAVRLVSSPPARPRSPLIAPLNHCRSGSRWRPSASRSNARTATWTSWCAGRASPASTC